MKKYNIFILIFLPLISSGQIIIDNYPKIGDSYITQAVFAKDISEGIGGENQI